MTAASSTDQALIQICSCAGSGETRARLATAAPRPTPLGQRRASGPGGRVPGDGVSAALRMVLVIEAPWMLSCVSSRDLRVSRAGGCFRLAGVEQVVDLAGEV